MSKFGPVNQHENVANLDNITLKYLIDNFGVKSMVDIGCGIGMQVKEAQKLGIKAIGIDGDPSLKIYDSEDYIFHDYTTGELAVEHCDLGWSMEFLEHVYEQYVPNILSTLVCCKYVCCTYAAFGKGGVHHVNCRNHTYWVDLIFNSHGFTYDSAVSDEIRKNTDSKWMKRTGLFFRNNRFS